MDPSRKYFTDSDELCSYVAAHTDGVCRLSFSCGKDSVASWLKLREHFHQVVAVYRYVVPGLRFIEESLAYYEDFFGQKILQYPNESFIRVLDNMVMQTPKRAAILADTSFSRYVNADDVMEDVEERMGRRDTFLASGLRAADSMHRRNLMRKRGVINYETRRFYPIFDWRHADMAKAFKDSGVKLPPDYAMFNRSFDSVRARFLPGIKRYYPDDFERIKRWFPLVDMELWRRRYHEEEKARCGK